MSVVGAVPMFHARGGRTDREAPDRTARPDSADSCPAAGLAIPTIRLILFSVLRFSTAPIKLPGGGGITPLAQIAGLLLAAIAVQLDADSVRGFIAGG
ncbi:hypothetical protein [Rhodococcus spelaei]|uniref:hypothetical protein n=1 Tax=Rhodococcus spelaei TaxID=2546320 RepID=UPI003F49260B